MRRNGALCSETKRWTVSTAAYYTSASQRLPPPPWSGTMAAMTGGRGRGLGDFSQPPHRRSHQPHGSPHFYGPPTAVSDPRRSFQAWLVSDVDVGPEFSPFSSGSP